MIESLQSTQSLMGSATQTQDRTANALKALRASAKAGNLDEQQARKAAEEFETSFLSSLFESMFKGIKTDGPFGGGQGEEMFRSMLNQEYAKAMVAQGGIGVADQVFNELRKFQEG